MIRRTATIVQNCHYVDDNERHIPTVENHFHVRTVKDTWFERNIYACSTLPEKALKFLETSLNHSIEEQAISCARCSKPNLCGNRAEPSRNEGGSSYSHRGLELPRD